MIDKEKKKDYNFWLTDSDFLQKSGYSDLYYLENLCFKINSFLKNTPIHAVASLDVKRTNQIYFMVGPNKKSFKIDPELSPYDFITKVKRWLYQFYPQYEIEYEEEIEYSDEEILKMVQEQGMNLNDALLKRKRVVKKEKGVIEKCLFKDDLFVLNVNGERSLWITGSVSNHLVVSKFKENFMKIEDDEEKYNYLMSNCRKYRDLNDIKTININYSGKQLLNFFKVNFVDLKDEPLVMIEDFKYQWGKFIITFESVSLKKDCLEYYKTRKQQDASN